MAHVTQSDDPLPDERINAGFEPVSELDGTAGEDEVEAVRAAYRTTFGTVPSGIEDRIAVARASGRVGSLLAIEELRRVLLADNPLDPRVQQLVHFGQLLALGHRGPARLHAGAARRAGASMGDLVGVVETALITAGMPAYGLGVEILAELARQE